MHIKTRINRIDQFIDDLFEKETGKEPNQNVFAVMSFAANRFGIDQNELARIYMGFSNDENYVTWCEGKIKGGYLK